LQDMLDGYKKRPDYQDRLDFKAIVQRIHKGHKTIKGIIDAPELKAYRRTYTGRDTLRHWVKEAIPDREFRRSASKKAK